MVNKMKLAFFSVYEKSGKDGNIGIVEFAKRLKRIQKGGRWGIISSGGTAKVLREAGIKVVDVADITKLKPMLDHRVATLHPRIHAGLLADFDNNAHLVEMARKHWDLFDMVCVDFYPLPEEIAKPGATRKSVVEKTDIGGPTLVRSGAKGLRIVICRPEDRESVLEELESFGNVSMATRETLAARAEFEAAKYVGYSAEYLGNGKFKIISGERVDAMPLKYGENAGQGRAVVYSFDKAKDDPLALESFQRIEGTAPSYVNITDIDRLLQTITHISQVFWQNWSQLRAPYIAVAVKHGNACGAAVGENFGEVLEKTILGDPLAIFGGFIMTNFPITDVEANTLLRTGLNPEDKNRIYDGVVAPCFSQSAIDMLARKATDKCRMFINPALLKGILPLDAAPRFRHIRGGFIVQPNYTCVPDFTDPNIFAVGKFSEQAKKDLALAWAIAATSNSNTISITRNGMLIGNGVGQQSRVAAASLAVDRATSAGHYMSLLNSSACSDSFFPFTDAVVVLVEAGVRNIFSTSGSKADMEIRDCCLRRSINLLQLPDAMVPGFFEH